MLSAPAANGSAGRRHSLALLNDDELECDSLFDGALDMEVLSWRLYCTSNETPL